MSSRPAKTRICQHCGAQWTNTGSGKRGAHPTLYCSPACRNAKRRNGNRTNKGIVPIGHTFTRVHDGAVVVVCQDARGLPFVEALRELAQMEVQGQ